MRLNIEGLARPVRTPERSSRATLTAFSIFSSASRRVSSITGSPLSARGKYSVLDGRVDQRADPLTPHRPRDVPLDEQVEHHDRHLVVHAEAERGGVRDLEALLQDLAVGDLAVHRGGRVDLLVG